MRVLVIAAHPDDEILGCGGTMARLAKEGHEVFISIMAEGITSRSDSREQADPEQIKNLHQRSRQAACLIGSRDLVHHGLPDNRLDTVPLLDVIKVVEKRIQELSPDRIYTHHGGDLNIDHGVVHRAVLTATRPMQGHPVRELYLFEIASSTEWSFQQFAPPFQPNVFVDIAATLDKKVEAMTCYESEVRPFPHPRSSQGLRVIAQRWGSVVGCEAAEAFQLVRAIV